ncbi:unnamed protein product [Candida verbasci]|uniref:OTU domain-containing protein n=1 Tax=Candida verbasci TaxID=1227364 RepID=A0A9W4XBY2_9ASCO|nr:unnamed protein product [Candida verbasci]
MIGEMNSDENFSISRDDIILRHKKEQKDLQNTVTGLKKQASKKTRKSVNSKCEQLQQELDRKHKEELTQFDGIESNEESELTPEQLLAQLDLKEVENDKPKAGLQSQDSIPKKKRNRAKEKLEKRKAEIEAMKKEASLEAENSIDYRQIEIDSFNQLLKLNNLTLFEIKPDGHCLFASIQDQLQTRLNIAHSIQELRDISANYILDNRDEFIPFLFDEETMQIKDVEEYCKELRETALWGSDMEILALAKFFNVAVYIFMAGASTIKINQCSEDKILNIGYFKHSYGLGEHYNSLRDSVESK